MKGPDAQRRARIFSRVTSRALAATQSPARLAVEAILKRIEAIFAEGSLTRLVTISRGVDSDMPDAIASEVFFRARARVGQNRRRRSTASPIHIAGAPSRRSASSDRAK
jgi:hypothetical protein